MPGGSSGGSAVAVAAGFAALGLGSDTGGSIRQPAALCGVVGVKPTYGAVSRYGLVAFASSLDQIGPFATTVADAAALLEVIGGHDPRDSTSIPGPLRPISPYARPTASRACASASSASCATTSTPTCWPASTPRRRAARPPAPRSRRSRCPAVIYGLTAYYLIAPAEASSNLARYDGVRYGLRVDAPRRRGHERRHPHRRVRRRGEAPHHARHLRPVGRLLRRLLRQGAQGAPADRRGLRPRLPAGRPAARRPPRRASPSRSAPRRRTRCSCTCPTSAPSRRTWPGTRP